MTDLHQGDGYFYDITPPKPKANGSDERKTNDSSAHRAPLPPKSRFTLVRFADLKAGDEPEYLVPGIIPAEGFGVIWGPPKEGKSFWAFDLFMHVALGWLYRSLEVQQGAVAYCAFEGATGFKKRAEAFRQRHPGADEAEFYLIGGRADLIKEHQQLIADIKKQAGEKPPRVIVLDTLNRSLVGSESKDADMRRYPGEFPWQRGGGCASRGISGDRPRGHTSLTGAVDFQLKVWKDDGNVYTEVEWLKEGEEGEVLASRLEQVEVGKDKHGNTITSCVVVPSEANPTVAASGPRLNKNQQTMFSVLYATGGQGLTTEEWNRRMRDDAGIGVKRKADLVDIRGQLEVRGAPFSVAGLQKMVERAGTEAKMPFKVHPHMLRHATGFALANKGTDTRTLQAYLGHRSIQSTVRYTELAPGRFKNLWR